jgi:D-alanine-D-alanine ligase
MSFKASKKLRVIVLMHHTHIPPDSIEGLSEQEVLVWKAEYDVIQALRRMGHEPHAIGVSDELNAIGAAIEEQRPHIAFNLLEEFDGYPLYDQHVISYLELRKQRYTGCNPRGLTIAHDKALTKQILAYHRIRVPGFAVFPVNRKVRRPRRLKFPLFVKSLVDEGSFGISQASLVNDDEKLIERVEFIHRQTSNPAIAEQYIEGREIYVGVLGNEKLQTFTPWEMVFKNRPEGASIIATGRVKWNLAYQKKVGLVTEAAALTPELANKLDRLSRRIYRFLSLSGYARLDYRVTDTGEIYLIEANPNPDISHGEDFADSAEHTGLKYEPLLQKIMTLGLRYDPMR